MDDDPICPKDVYETHIIAFVNSFVERNRRDRWLHLLLKRPKKLFRNSHKLHDCLDKTRCAESLEPDSLEDEMTGMFCDFWSDSNPILVSARRAIELGTGHDALFSVSPGKHAVYFFHEDFVMECHSHRKEKT